MSGDHTRFEVTNDFTVPSRPRKDESTFVRIAPFRRFGLGKSLELVYFPLTGTRKVLSTKVANVLSCCVQMRPLFEHAQTLSPFLGDPLKLLEELKESGAMISYADVAGRLREEAGVEAKRASISRLCVPTRNRPQELRRALESYVANVKDYSRTVQLVVADDSSCLEGREATKATLDTIARSSGIPIFYAGLEEKLAFIDAVVNEGNVPRDIVEFSLLGPPNCQTTPGANRNAILLQTLGQVILTSDDDSICQVGTVAGEEQRRITSFGGEWDVPEFWFPSNRNSALQFVKFQRADIFSEHEELLGRSLSGVVSEDCQNSLRLDNPCPHLLQSLIRSEGRIPLTFAGVAGDCGMDSFGWICLNCNPDTRQRMTVSERAFRTALVSREVVRQFLTKVVCHAGTAMTAAVGLDNRNLLPPFFSGYRNEDGLFVATVKKCQPGAFFGHVPWVVVHAPRGPRVNDTNWATRIRVSDLIIECLSASPNPIGGKSVAERMVFLGEHLVDLGSLPLKEFNERIHLVTLKRWSELIQRYENAIARFESYPEFWVREVRSHIDALQRAMLREDTVFPNDLIEKISPSLPLQAVQNLFKSFGSLLKWWPSIVENVRILSQREIALARRRE